MTYTNKQLIQLAQTNPQEFVRFLTSHNNDIKLLTAGAEILGLEITDELLVNPVFRILLKHVNALVREAACIGVSSFYVNKKPPQDIVEKIKLMSTTDPSLIVRDYSESLLQDFEAAES